MRNLRQFISFAGFAALLLPSAHAVDRVTIPKFIYHYGVYDVLTKDVEARTIPPADWDKYIVGDATRYGQKWYRRGLYGSVHPAYSAYFSDIQAGNGKQQWLMSVEITDVCRTEKPFDLTSLYQDLRVSKYIHVHPDSPYRSLIEFRDACYPYNEQIKRRLPDFETITGTRAINACEGFLNSMFVALLPKVVVDSDWPGSWYVRDRNCIKTIKGTPAEVAEMLTIPGFWSKKNPSGGVREGSPTENTSGLAILIKVLTSEDALNKISPQRLLMAVEKSDMRNSLGWQSGNEKPGWMAKIGTKIIRKYIECDNSRRTDLFRKNLSQLLQELNQSKNFDLTAEMIGEKAGC